MQRNKRASAFVEFAALLFIIALLVKVIAGLYVYWSLEGESISDYSCERIHMSLISGNPLGKSCDAIGKCLEYYSLADEDAYYRNHCADSANIVRVVW